MLCALPEELVDVVVHDALLDGEVALLEDLQLEQRRRWATRSRSRKSSCR